MSQELKKAWKEYEAWVRKAWLDIAAVIVILLILGYFLSNIESRVTDRVKECNEHWKTQIKRVCPGALNASTWITIPEQYAEAWNEPT